MIRRCLLLSVIAIVPLISSCSSLRATLAGGGVTALMSVKHSNETSYGYYDLGRYYHERSQWAAASEAYKKALTLDARHYEAHNALGVVYSMQVKTDLAVEHFRSAIAIAPRLAHLHNNLGHAYYLQGNNPDAIDSLEAAATLDSRNQRILHNLKLAYERAGLAEKSEQITRALNAVLIRERAAVASVLGKPGAPVQKAPAFSSADTSRPCWVRGWPG